jgi:small subunit ribosomal protein S14
MSTKALENKAAKAPKYKSRGYTRCQICGRARAVYRKFHICRICFRTMANEGKIPGVRKASW